MSEDRGQRNEWMDRAASGDDAAFEALALSTQDDLFRFALAHGLRDADAAEVAQETFLRAYRMRQNWRAGGQAMGWLLGIAMNVVREFRRRNAARPSENVELESLTEGQADRPGNFGRSGGEELSPSDVAVRNTKLQAAIATLPPRQQEAVACRYLLEMSLAQTAELMGCAEGTVKAAVFAGLENLRKMLKLSE